LCIKKKDALTLNYARSIKQREQKLDRKKRRTVRVVNYPKSKLKAKSKGGWTGIGAEEDNGF